MSADVLVYMDVRVRQAMARGNQRRVGRVVAICDLSSPYAAHAENLPGRYKVSDGRKQFQRGCAGRRGRLSVEYAGLLALLVASAALMALAVNSREHPWLGLFSLLPLLRAIQRFRAAPAFLCGAVWGASLHAFCTMSVGGAIPPGIGSLLLLTAIPGVYAALGAWTTRRAGFSPLVLATGWMLVEFALHPLALQHGLLAGTQGDGILTAIVGRVFGFVMMAFVVAFASAWLLAIVCRIRIRVARPALNIEPGSSGAILWQLILTMLPRYMPCQAHPRAPPCWAESVTS